jgi:acyl-[acyl carrier protein]--UDP-N-acetylglucosamine O-acyltransferase
VLTSTGPITFSNNNIGLMYSAPLTLSQNAITLDTSSDLIFNGALTLNSPDIIMENIPEVTTDTYNVTIDRLTKRLAYQSNSGVTIEPTNINNVTSIKGKQNSQTAQTEQLKIQSGNDTSSMILDNTGNIVLSGDSITIGNSNSVVNILGTSTSVQSSTVTNQRVVLNKGGNTASSLGSGIEIEANGVIVGYIKTNNTGTAYNVKVPNDSKNHTMMMRDSLGNMNMTGNLSVNTNKFILNSDTGDLTIGGTATVLKDINMNGLLTCVSGCYIVGDVDVIGGLDINGDSKLNTTNVRKTLDVSGNTTLKNTTITGVLTATGQSNTFGNTTIDGTIEVKNNTNLNRSLYVIGSTTVTGETQLTDVSFNGSFNATNPLSTVNIAGSTIMKKNLHVGGAFDTSGNSVLRGDLRVNGKSSLNDEVYIGSNVFVNGLNCNVTISGDTIIGKNANIYGDAMIEGVTVLKKNVYVDGRTRLNDLIDVSGVATIAGETILRKTLDVSGATRIDGYTRIGSSLDVSGNLDVSGSTTIGGNVFIKNITKNPIGANAYNLRMDPGTKAVFYDTNNTFSAPLYADTLNNIIISQSNASTDGYLSSTDWDKFNSKQDHLSIASADVSGILSASDWSMFNNK